MNSLKSILRYIATSIGIILVLVLGIAALTLYRISLFVSSHPIKIVRVPQVVTTSSVLESSTQFNSKSSGWLPARPLSYPYTPIIGFIKRVRIAVKVFLGKYDALDWQDNDKD